MTQKFANNASSTLATDLLAANTTLQVAAAAGDLFPVISPAADDDFFLLTIENALGKLEVVKCTLRNSATDTMTIVRGQESTAASDFISGDRVEIRLTKSTLEGFLQRSFGDTLDGGLE